MKTRRQHFGLSHKLLFLAVLAAFGPVHAEDDEVAQVIKPDSTVVSAGLGVASGNSADRAIFGQYNGWRKNEVGILLDFELIRRDDASGLWTNFSGSNLGLDNRELTFSQQKQGDWGYSAGYSELVRHEPRSVITGVLGSGTTNPVVNPAAGLSESNLELKRKGLTVGLEKWLTPNLMVEASFKTEKRMVLVCPVLA
ncbi:MAG: MtrB/PioB family outer membrane beta-barrel protein [Rhodocyclaceae bacterium]|nr:MtrB/PioB family outer membrane beta-barrel protein [Rhodocyclaceae bacterium]